MSIYAELIQRWCPRPSGRVLLLNIGDPELFDSGDLAQVVSRDQCHFLFDDHQRFEASLSSEPPYQALVFPDQPPYLFDQIYWQWPKSKEEADMLLRWMAPMLSDDGALWLIGHNRSGIKSAPKRLQQQGWSVRKAGSARHCLLLRAQPPPRPTAFDLTDYWACTPLPGEQAESAARLWTLPGVFSHGRIDKGSAELLPWLTDLPSPVLDFGCGGGLLALALAQHQPATRFCGVDNHWLAILSSQRTAKANDLDLTPVWSDGLQQLTGRFGSLITNPPFHHGQDINYDITRRLITDSRQYLYPGAQWLAVVNDHLPYSEWLKSNFREVSCLQHARGFKVWTARV